MNEFEALGQTMNALLKEQKRQEEVAIEQMKESVKLERLRQNRERNIQRQRWQRQQRQIGYQRQHQMLEATKSLYEGEIEKLSQLAQNAQGLSAQQLELMMQKRTLEIMEIDQELSGIQPQNRSWLRLQIEQLNSRIEALDEVLQTQEQMELDVQLKQMEEEQLKEEALRLVALKRELTQKYPPDVVNQILTEMRRLQAEKMARKDYYSP